MPHRGVRTRPDQERVAADTPPLASQAEDAPLRARQALRAIMRLRMEQGAAPQGLARVCPRKRESSQGPSTPCFQTGSSFNHLVGTAEEPVRNREAERLCGFQIDRKRKRAGSSKGKPQASLL